MKGGPLRRINDRFSRAVPPADATMNRRTAAGRDRRAKLVPLGADEPFEPMEPLEPLTDEERNALGGLWDRSQSNGKYAGMLDAELEDDEDA